jgi:dienelactone hydrolase
MRWMTMMLAWALSMNALAAPDYAREKKWADEVLPGVLTGDPVYLAQDDSHKYLNLYAAGDAAKTAVVLVHGIGVHPDWGLIGMLRQRLADAGHATLSVQMPLLAADAKGEAYVPTFDLAARRLATSVDWLKAKGYGRIAIVSHSLGCRMTYRYLTGMPSPAVVAWAALSASGADDYARLPLRILDVYGDNDLAHIVKNAPLRATGLKQAGSAQSRIAGADHFYEGKDDALYATVAGFVDAP